MTPIPGRPIKILHVVRQYSPSVGGLEAYVRDLVKRQARQHHVEILTLNRLFGSPQPLPRTETIGGITVHRVPYLGWRELFVPALPVRFLAGFDLVHVHATDQLLDLVWLASLARLVRRYVVTTHGLYFHTPKLAAVKRLYLRFLTRHSLKRSAAVFAVSANDAAIVRSVGVEPILLRNPVEPIGDFLASGRDLLYLGRIAPNKEIGRLLAFFAQALERDPDLRLHLAGSDPDRLWPAISAPFAALIDKGAVTYHGFLSSAELRAVSESCGYVVSASSYEGFGMSMVEGMSVGLLPVMHDNAAFREIHALSGVGLICDFASPATCAERFLAWRQDVAPESGRVAADYARAQSWDAAVEVVEAVYRRADHEPV